MNRRVYLAGPAVFRRDAVAEGARLRALCAAHGFVGLFPLDGSGPHTSGLAGPNLAGAIFDANMAMLRSAALVLADLSPFRGPHVDDGTAFEVGAAHSLGIPVYAWSADLRPLIERIPADPASDGRWRDAGGLEVEDFGLSHNLMLAAAVINIWPGPAEALAAAAVDYLPAKGYARR
jgi:nucleoside deoxyribosyltransferase